MSTALIRAAFETRLNTWAASEGFPVAWQNAEFTPPATTYLRAFILPADTDSADLAGQHREYRGVFQVSLCLPINGGNGDALVSALDALFPTTAPMTSGGLDVWIVRPMSAAAGIPDEDRYIVPVSCEYRAHTYA